MLYVAVIAVTSIAGKLQGHPCDSNINQALQGHMSIGILHRQKVPLPSFRGWQKVRMVKATCHGDLAVQEKYIILP